MGEGGKHLDIGAIAAVARLAISEGEGEVLANQLERIVSYADRMKELDLDGVEPFFCALPMDSVLADDVADGSLPQEEVLANAPQGKNGQITVPRIVEGE
ncbi:MAG: Asp-tRNA(Asn)/Glu-tRNA(Gln) amidotransferase subunit GatC [Puniceicoccales bacterium]|nr:Asp-tRNA(Asn)/Glu-tRNA(Gln) amidotransferase subunit GatC [Puniceicoccales bacterium]